MIPPKFSGDLSSPGVVTREYKAPPDFMKIIGQSNAPAELGRIRSESPGSQPGVRSQPEKAQREIAAFVEKVWAEHRRRKAK